MTLNNRSVIVTVQVKAKKVKELYIDGVGERKNIIELSCAIRVFLEIKVKIFPRSDISLLSYKTGSCKNDKITSLRKRE